MKHFRIVLITLIVAIAVSMSSSALADSEDLSAGFSSDATSGVAPFTVHFTDHSTGGATEWHWNFGDDSYSTRQDPTHTFQTPGTYHVTLTITDGYESSTTSSEIAVTIGQTAIPRPIYVIVPAKPIYHDKPAHPDQPKIDKPVKVPDGKKGHVKDPVRNGDHKKRN